MDSSKAKKSAFSLFGPLGYSATDDKDVSSADMAPGIPISSITFIRRGAYTEVFLKTKRLDPNCCLSLITNDRTLDLQFKTHVDRDVFFRAMKGLFEDFPEYNVKFS